MMTPVPEPDEHADVAELGYAEAMAELDAILVEIDRDDVDLDHLAERMRRAAALIERCRGRIADARVEVEKVAADLSALETPVPPADAEDEPS
jgi:exodeoxyribonuclease VII small subunit